MKYYHKYSKLSNSVKELVTKNDYSDFDYVSEDSPFRSEEERKENSRLVRLRNEGFTDLTRKVEEGVVDVTVKTTEDLMCVLDYYTTTRWSHKASIKLTIEDKVFIFPQINNTSTIYGKASERLPETVMCEMSKYDIAYINKMKENYENRDKASSEVLSDLRDVIATQQETIDNLFSQIKRLTDSMSERSRKERESDLPFSGHI